MPPRPSLNANLTSRSVSAMAHVTTRHCRVRTSAEWYRGLASTHVPCHPKSRSSAAQRVRCLRIRCKRLSVGVGLVPGDSPMCEAQTHLEYWKSGWPRWMRGRRSIRSVCASAVYAPWRLACAANARCPARLGRLLARACSHREQARPDSVCRSLGRPLLSSGPGRNLHTPLSRACLQGPPLEGSKAWALQPSKLHWSTWQEAKFSRRTPPRSSRERRCCAGRRCSSRWPWERSVDACNKTGKPMAGA